jgi:hypothetical protein
MKSLQLIAIWLLMLALPLQGLAAFTPSARCDDGRAAPAIQATSHLQHDHHGATAGGHDHPADQQQQPNNSQAEGHSCCHHVFSGMPSADIPGAPAAPDSVAVHVSLLSTLHFPELPQRPPRA